MSQIHQNRRKSSTITTTMSLKSIQRRSSLISIEGESDVSDLSFKRWHKRMQARHESHGGSGFQNWQWCNTACKPCRWFDSIPYDYKICKYWFKFKTLKIVGTFTLLAVFAYVLMYSFWGDQLLPGGTVFFLFLLFLAAYFSGYILLFAGLPPMVGHILIGMLCGNVPQSWLPPYDKHLLEKISYSVEKSLLIIAIIRAGLLLDMSRIKGHVPFIIQISVVPLACEQFIVLIVSHYLLRLPWDWSALQGSLLCIVSLATITSIMEKNRSNGYGEDKHLSTVLIAASSTSVILGIFSYIICLSFIYPGKWAFSIHSSVGQMFANIAEQILIGLTTGLVCGFLIAFFPDKRNAEAATVRILVLGLGSFSVALICAEFNMIAGGALAVIIMCLVASNMWTELGWHDRNNPVQYFYTMVYYYAQPVALSLVGFSMNFQNTDSVQIGLSISVIIIGLVGKEAVCYLVTYGNSYPTTVKEKIFICIAWFSKGTFQALLAYAAEYMTEENESAVNQNDSAYTNHIVNARIVKDTTVLAILLTTPLACYGLALLSPTLLTKVTVERVSNNANPGNSNQV